MILAAEATRLHSNSWCPKRKGALDTATEPRLTEARSAALVAVSKYAHSGRIAHFICKEWNRVASAATMIIGFPAVNAVWWQGCYERTSHQRTTVAGGIPTAVIGFRAATFPERAG